MVGAGSLGYHHIRLLKDLPGARFVGFFDTDAGRRATVERELGVPAAASYDALLEACDALTVVVPTPAHCEVASRAIAAGRHVLIEKPLTVTLEEADRLLALAARHGVKIQTGHIERFNRAVVAALPYIRSPRFIQSDRLAPFNPRGSDVAVVLDLMIHDIDLVGTLVGGHVQELHAIGVPVLTPMVDIANARIVFDHGAVANITASRVSRDRMRKLRIFQPSGYLSLDLGAGNGEFYRLKADVNVAEIARAPAALESFLERIPLEGPPGEPLKLELESFVGALRGEREVAVTGEDGRTALEIALRIVSEIERGLPALAAAQPATTPGGASAPGLAGA